jgi:hypothetical protein
MSNYESEEDKIRNRIIELEKRHRKLDSDIEILYNNITISEEVRRMKTMKLYLKDEIHKLNSKLVQLGLE